MKRVTLFSFVFLLGTIWRSPSLLSTPVLFLLATLVDIILTTVISTAGPLPDMAWRSLFLFLGLAIGTATSLLVPRLMHVQTGRTTSVWPVTVVFISMVLSDFLIGQDASEFMPISICVWFLASLYMIKGTWGYDILCPLAGAMIMAPLLNLGTWPDLSKVTEHDPIFPADSHWGNLGDEAMTLLFVLGTTALGGLSLIIRGPSPPVHYQSPPPPKYQPPPAFVPSSNPTPLFASPSPGRATQVYYQQPSQSPPQYQQQPQRPQPGVHQIHYRQTRPVMSSVPVEQFESLPEL